MPPRGKKSTGLDYELTPIQAASISNSQNMSRPEMPSLESCGSASSNSFSASAVNYPLRAASQLTPLCASWKDLARPNYSDLSDFERATLRSSDTMDSFKHSQMPTRAGESSYLDETHKPEPPNYKVPKKYDYQPYHAGREIASIRMDRGEDLSPTECYSGAESYQAAFRVEEHTQEFQIEQQQKYKSEEMFGNNSSYFDSSESSQSLPDPFCNPDTADTVHEKPKELAHGTYPPGHLVTKNEEAIMGHRVKAVGGDSHAMAESSSEGSNGDQLHKDIEKKLNLSMFMSLENLIDI